LLKSIVSGLRMDAKPRIQSILKIFEPAIFPRDIANSPFLAAIIYTTVSGNEVPAATMVAPISQSATPAERASFTA